MRPTDAIHLGLMLAAVGLTYLVPFEFLLLNSLALRQLGAAVGHGARHMVHQRG
jgi:hypothetical protein